MILKATEFFPTAIEGVGLLEVLVYPSAGLARFHCIYAIILITVYVMYIIAYYITKLFYEQNFHQNNSMHNRNVT